MGSDGETPPPAAGGDPFVVPEEQHDVTLDAAVSGADIRPETEGDVAVAMGESVQGGDTPVQRDRRPHRRRGRRGGRRGRETRGPGDGSSDGGGTDSSDDGSSTPQGN
jgi:hypothetical protein